MFLSAMSFGRLEVFAGIYLGAIEMGFRFAQVLNVLVCLAFMCLLQVLRSRDHDKICYNSHGSRKCTLKTKYVILLKRGPLCSRLRFKASET